MDMKKFASTSVLIRQLRAVLTRQRAVLAAAGLLTTVAVAVLAWVLLSLLANFMVLPVWLKIVLMLLAAMATGYSFGRYAIGHLWGGSIDSVAVALEQKNPTLRGRLIAAVQFSRLEGSDGFSPDLIRVTQEQALREAGSVDFNEVVSFHPVLRNIRLFVGAAVLAVALLLISPGLFRYAFEVYSHPTVVIAPPVAYRVTAVPQSTEWVKYRDIRIGGTVVGRRLPDKAYIWHRPAGGSWQSTKVDLAAVSHLAVADGDSLDFGVTLRQINRSFDFYVESGRLKTDVQQIDVVDRPRVTGIRLEIFYPDYTGLSPVTLDENSGSFSAVTGSRVNMRVTANLPVEKAELVFEDSSRTPLKVLDKTAEVALAVDRSRAYRIELLDHLGETNPDPIEYYITAVPDEYPSIDVVRPGFDVNLTDEMVLPLKVRIFDDYGFSSLVMKYIVVNQGRPSDEHVAVLHFSDKIKTEGDVEFNWDMDALNIFPGDYVQYSFEVADNDVISGPKITHSRQFIARLPSLDEIIAQTERESMRRITTTEDLIRSGKDLSRRLKDAARKLEAQSKESRTAEWQHQKELESIAEKNEEMLQQISQTAKDMEKSLERMQQEALMSREILERLQQVQKLFEEVATPEMREAQQRLMDQLKQMDRDKLLKAMQEFELSQEEMLERLERTLALLKRLQVQQKMEAMLRQAEEIVKRQSNVNEKTEASDKEALPRLSQNEAENREALQQLKKETDELRELMQQAEMNEMPEAQQFVEAIEKTEADQSMGQMIRAMQAMSKQQSSSEGKKAHSELLEMLDQMQQANLAMNNGSNEQLERDMRRACDHANNLSQNQEELLREAQAIDPRSVVIRDMAASQQDLTEACRGLKHTIEELGKESPFIAAELQGVVNSACQNMDLATMNFDAKKGSTGARNQHEAMVDLNRAATRLMESLEQQKNCKNPGSCNKKMAQMESLCQKQNQLNQQCQGSCSNPRPGQSGEPTQSSQGQESRTGLQRLASEQGAIRKSMEQLEQEFGGSRQILGRLSDITREMEKVEESLMKGDIGPETTERQLKIYSRMLEATRTLQRKDFSDQRRASSAEDQPVYVPPTLPDEIFDDNVQLEDRLRHFLGDSYPPQYEEQIKAYFRALLKIETERNNAGYPGENQ